MAASVIMFAAPLLALVRMPCPAQPINILRFVEEHCEKEGQFCFGSLDGYSGIDELSVVDGAWLDYTGSIYPTSQCIGNTIGCGAAGCVLSVPSKGQ